MGHEAEVYIYRGMTELGDFGGATGLDKIGVVAPEVVQMALTGRSYGRKDPAQAELGRGTLEFRVRSGVGLVASFGSCRVD
jgi:hypothetical protein